MPRYAEMSKAELEAELAEVRARYGEMAARGLKLNMARGKPSAAQLELSLPMLDVLDSEADLAAEDPRSVGRNSRHLGTDIGSEQFRIVLARRRAGRSEQRQCDIFQRFHILRILKVIFQPRRPSGTRRSTWPGWCI